MVSMIILVFLFVALGAGLNILVLAWSLSRIGDSSSKKSDVSSKRS